MRNWDGVERTMKCAIYVRASTSDQNCEMQLRKLREYISRRGWEIASEYVDTGWSGAKTNRPQLRRLKREAKERRFDAFLVWKLDRWGRSAADSVSGIEALLALVIRWIAIAQNLDTDESNPMARSMRHVMAAFAELEREMIRERSRAGFQSYHEAYAKGLVGDEANGA
jgi:site-specific DNA recombinase